MKRDNEVEDVLLSKCLGLVEDKLKWGSGSQWTTKDFEALREQIFRETKVSLSLATLKRLWGKMKYDSKPTASTLDVIAQFVGYQNWRTFSQSYQPPYVLVQDNQQDNEKQNIDLQAEKVTQVKATTQTSRSKRNVVIALSLGLSVTLLVAFMWPRLAKKPSNKLDAELFSFSSRKIIREGVPNSVVFDYDARIASATDTLLIQQSWDPQLQQQISRSQRQATSIYYFPGFFKAKLIVNRKVVKEHDLLITTDGWLPLIVRDHETPVYFKEADVQNGGALSLPVEKIEASNIPMQPAVPTIQYFNVRTFNELTSANFRFETALKNTYREGAGVCQLTNVTLLCEENFISIPLSAKGCISDLTLSFLGNEIDGKKEDLSAFGCDFKDWVKLTFEVKNKHSSIYINDILIYEAPVDATPTKITGIVFNFRGSGSVDFVKLSKTNGEVVFEDDF